MWNALSLDSREQIHPNLFPCPTGSSFLTCLQTSEQSQPSCMPYYISSWNPWPAVCLLHSCLQVLHMPTTSPTLTVKVQITGLWAFMFSAGLRNSLDMACSKAGSPRCWITSFRPSSLLHSSCGWRSYFA